MVRWLSVALALIGAGIAGYLAAYQLGTLSSIWDPFFGTQSGQVLHSAISRALPVPDALLGAVAYLMEAIGITVEGPDAGRRKPRWASGIGFLVAGMALGSFGLVLIQAFFVKAWCTLCLLSAAISWIIAVLSWPEARSAALTLLHRRGH